MRSARLRKVCERTTSCTRAPTRSDVGFQNERKANRKPKEQTPQAAHAVGGDT
jgi:hypothetical protein